MREEMGTEAQIERQIRRRLIMVARDFALMRVGLGKW
jgi:hypothetical protein